MMTNVGEWDGANTFTMNVFAVMFFLSFSFVRWSSNDKNLNIAIGLVIGVSVGDLIDRFVLRITEKTDADIFGLILAVLFVLIDYNHEKIHRWLLKFKLYSYLCLLKSKE